MSQVPGAAGEPAAFPQRSQATTSLVLGILGMACCGILAPIAWYISNQELRNIREGRVAPTNEGMAKAGQILGIVGTVLLAIGLVFLFLFGGFALLMDLQGFEDLPEF